METEDKEKYALELLSPAIGSRHRRKRVGRGEATGLGKTAGRGHKGQGARSGAPIPAWFEGGQMPLYRRVGKVGFRSPKQFMKLNQYRTIPVSFLEGFEAGSTVNAETLAARGVVAGLKYGAGIKVLGDGDLTKNLTVELNAVTASARQKIEAAGGTVVLVKSAGTNSGSTTTDISSDNK